MKIITDPDEIAKLHPKERCEVCIFCTEKNELIQYIHRDETVAKGIEEMPEHIPVMDSTFTCQKYNKEVSGDHKCDDFISNENGGVQ